MRLHPAEVHEFEIAYRLNTVEIDIPPLRERRDDIPLLANHFLDRIRTHYGRDLDGFSPAALEALMRHPWPGNVRELEHSVERSVTSGGHVRFEASRGAGSHADRFRAAALAVHAAASSTPAGAAEWIGGREIVFARDGVW